MLKRPDWMSFEKFRESRRQVANTVKAYLKGRVLPGTASRYVEKGRKFRDSFAQQRSPSFLEKKKEHRRMRNKMARHSRRINRLRAR